MKTKQTVSGKKQSIVVKDLKAKKNPKGGAAVDFFLKIDRMAGLKVNPTSGLSASSLTIK